MLLGIAAVPFLVLTYRFRKNKFLLCSIPLAFLCLVHYFKKGYRKLFEGIQRRLQLEQRDFEAAHYTWIHGRQFGVTTGGRVGLIPLSAKVGDDVGLFAGCRVPFVLRKFKNGYRIMGDAYVHGVMNGEGDKSEGEMLRIV
jgi:hypothetical protein